MTRDEVVASALVLAFAALVTTHGVLVATLAAKPPRWHALAALVVPPLAPYWGARRGRYVGATLWAVSAVAYLVLRQLART
jgi:hypothetical protein